MRVTKHDEEAGLTYWRCLTPIILGFHHLKTSHLFLSVTPRINAKVATNQYICDCVDTLPVNFIFGGCGGLVQSFVHVKLYSKVLTVTVRNILMNDVLLTLDLLILPEK